ncbi:bifunctional diaminohydroxyphosphoribosylaminopyrimidine deaminase/5-amino-6-(5-phosphoribosylamino)uracil reductase RibD [Jannaschia sp. W003]|uniref:bifunctional diaminohydroxyphosphoribosylaminopyrimidine deaminase/5-amino-6-(5-phosphoribosylamino)uracil reductase RibD n=1 Tax=Jannaschia sp. W003 TaxID=2867012 RepID=UPI0021A5D328|nr:bifunctional diaminohydroxyphosphoribosylaminopyrimidine deaminase/5-amino-6-(5-phosphoribosylamino)uracil reductase RibD [Jannaschia sp. W003]UWQ20018.1 bifunctional diaminohydroxyphosphoribosylaminopyrimidine deaminase/5-amino-6-(5-phosphoribosylamino)uracil reductase RibD [Jannaschia sp. W003]
MSDPNDARWMAAALALAARGLGRVWPNPAVGCVVVRDGRVVGRGRTADGGRPHAEAVALAEAGSAARGATAYVTLEPCAHHGRTPPCAEALVAAGVARVVVAAGDPDGRVDGRGLAILRGAGIEVTTGVMEAEARALQAGFLSRVERGRPFLTLKLATTLDGRIATASGESRWITGPAARAHVHARRAAFDAVMVGAGTARADDPQLTVRGMGERPQPVRVVLARALALDPALGLVRTAREVPTWLVHATGDPAPFEAAGAACIRVLETAGHIDLPAALAALGQRGLTRVYCEGGGTLAASLLRAGLVDRLECYTAGAAIGADGIPALGPIALAKLADAPRLRLAETRPLGPDTFTAWEP